MLKMGAAHYHYVHENMDYPMVFGSGIMPCHRMPIRACWWDLFSNIFKWYI